MPLDLVDDPFVPTMHVAAHVGVGAALLTAPGQVEHTGAGPYVDLEVARRMSPPVSLSVHGSYFTSGDDGGDADFGYSTTWSRDRIVDVAARATYHVYDEADGPFFGAGFGYEAVRATGVDACMMPDSPPCIDPNGKSSVSFYEPFNQWSHGILVEVYAGITLPKIEVASIRFLATLTHSTAAGAPYTARAAVGVEF